MTVVSLLGASACGTPCSRIAAGEAAANDKGTACKADSTPWDSAHVSRCESGLSKCSADDQQWLDTYADCLQKLPVCSSGQGFSWGLQRVGCAESLLKVSANCLSATK